MCIAEQALHTDGSGCTARRGIRYLTIPLSSRWRPYGPFRLPIRVHPQAHPPLHRSPTTSHTSVTIGLYMIEDGGLEIGMGTFGGFGSTVAHRVPARLFSMYTKGRTSIRYVRASAASTISNKVRRSFLVVCHWHKILSILSNIHQLPFRVPYCPILYAQELLTYAPEDITPPDGVMSSAHTAIPASAHLSVTRGRRGDDDL